MSRVYFHNVQGVNYNSNNVHTVLVDGTVAWESIPCSPITNADDICNEEEIWMLVSNPANQYVPQDVCMADPINARATGYMYGTQIDNTPSVSPSGFLGLPVNPQLYGCLFHARRLYDTYPVPHPVYGEMVEIFQPYVLLIPYGDTDYALVYDPTQEIPFRAVPFEDGVYEYGMFFKIENVQSSVDYEYHPAILTPEGEYALIYPEDESCSHVFEFQYQCDDGSYGIDGGGLPILYWVPERPYSLGK